MFRKNQKSDKIIFLNHESRFFPIMITKKLNTKLDLSGCIFVTIDINHLCNQSKQIF